MNNFITVFNFEQCEIRFVDGKPIANDVAAILGFKNPADAVYRLVKSKNKGVCKIQTPGGMQSVTVLEEAGIYQLIFSSKLPSAEKFQDWVFEEVLPTLRKTGSYHLTIPKPSQPKLGAYIDRVHSMVENSRNIPFGYWCVLHESANLLIYVETVLKMPVDKADLLDGSIGLRWSKYREGKEWCGNRVQFSYTFPDGRIVSPWCYSFKELENFRLWLQTDYQTKYLPEYLSSKYGFLIHSRVA